MFWWLLADTCTKINILFELKMQKDPCTAGDIACVFFITFYLCTFLTATILGVTIF